jgi:hypothetical protein
VDIRDQVGTGQIEFVVARIDEDTLVIDHGPHRTVKDANPIFLDKFSKCSHISLRLLGFRLVSFFL